VASPTIDVRRTPDDVIYLQWTHPLAPYPGRLTERLDYWASRTPGAPFLAERDGNRWRTVTYGEARHSARNIGQALIDRHLSNDRPVVILSGNSIEHALLALGAMYVGVLYAPIAPAYSLLSGEFTALRQVFNSLRPGLVFVDRGAKFERALRTVLPAGCEVVAVHDPPAGLQATAWSDVAGTPATAAVDDAAGRVDGDSVAKILFTSGSTGHPKGVINTQRMLCSNQEMIRTVMPFLAEEPPVLCDWLPWNHTAGGNHNFGLVLYNGGTFYIDEGRPTPSGIDAMVRNLREVAADAHFTVPRTYEALLPYMERDKQLRETFFSRLKIFFFAAAGLSQRVFDAYQALAVETRGEKLLWVTGLGATETAPFALCTGDVGGWAGFIGFPVPGLEMKLAPVGLKREIRVRGPNITPGYWRDEARTQAAFDEEGYYRMGDAVRFVDADDPAKGLIFDGRLADDFKLSSGTWVSVGALRTRLLAHAGAIAQDAVIAAPDRPYVAALIFPNVDACRALCPGLAAGASAHAVVEDPRVRAAFLGALEKLAQESSGNSTHVARALLLDEPPSLDAREVTDKGSLNQKAVLANRSALVEELYAEDPGARVIALSPETAQRRGA